MENKNYFVFAVMIAIIIPVAMGSYYFISMYNKKGAGEYLSKLQNKDEVLILGDIELSDISNSDSLISSDLVVKYTYGDNLVNNYKICLGDVSFSNELDSKRIKWELYMYDDSLKKYLELSFGNLGAIKSGELCLSPNLQIGNGETQRFKLNYYYDFQDLDNMKKEFYAKVIIE